MGNTIVGARTAKVMKVDGSTFRVKPPITAGRVVANHPGYHLLDSSDVKRLSIRAPPLEPSHPLKSGKVYFLVELPRFPGRRILQQAWSGVLNVTARDRLESLKLSRRSVSDLSIGKTLQGRVPAAEPEIRPEGPMQLRVRLPRAQVAKIMEENFDAAEAVEKIVELFLATEEKVEPLPVAEPTARLRLKREEISYFHWQPTWQNDYPKLYRSPYDAALWCEEMT